MTDLLDTGGRVELPDLTVVVPARNAEGVLIECLESVRRAAPCEIVVVDGNSTDATVEIARRYGATVLSDEGRGLPAARTLGVEHAKTQMVALVDADVVLRDGALRDLLREYRDGGYLALQAGLSSVGGPGYWGRALAHHHRTGRSKNWFGVVATVMERDTLLRHGFDDRFASGEDIDLRHRLARSGGRIGVSDRTVVEHRFAEDSFAFAREQWLADGRGLGRMVQAHRWRGAHLVLLPLAAAVRGIGLSVARREWRWLPYYFCFGLYNYIGMLGLK